MTRRRAILAGAEQPETKRKQKTEKNKKKTCTMTRRRAILAGAEQPKTTTIPISGQSCEYATCTPEKKIFDFKKNSFSQGTEL